MSFLRQTYFLIRKNFQTKKRNKRNTLQELIIPVYWVLILLIIRLTAKVQDLPAVPSEKIPRFKLGIENGGGWSNNSIKSVIGIVTNTSDPQLHEVLSLIKNLSSYRTTYKEFKNSEEMEDYYRMYGESSRFQMGIIFQKDQETAGISYTLRMAEGMMPDLKTKIVDPGKCHDVNAFNNPFLCPANQYIFNSISTLQSFIDSAISKVLGGMPYIIVPKITVQMMPKRVFPQSISGFDITVPIYMVMAFAPYITVLLVNLVTEKKMKHKELLRIMGMKDTAYWLSWFLTYAIILLIAVIIIIAIAVPADIFGNSNFLLLVIIFYLFGLSLIHFAFMLAPLFKTPMTAGTVANLSTIIFGVLLIPVNQPGVSNYGKWLACLLSPTAFALTLTQGIDSTGLQFNNLSTKGDFPPLYPIIMIIVDIFLYLGIALYLDAVIPAEYGRRRPLNFIFLPSFWKSFFVNNNMNNTDIKLSRQMSARDVQKLDDVEPVGPEMIGKEAISIHKLKKVFPGKNKVVAVDGFSMDIYEGQVTALLGHNGAGKSTLIAALTGMIEPTSGTALIYGKDITNTEDMDNIRRNIGVCPQQDVLFDFLTIEEHLDLYAGLKGIPSEERKTMVASVIKEIDLEDKVDDLAKNLSGGQKRKLCVGIALMANPKVLFLDEPTSGMDPHSRRHMWSLLERQAKDKVVLLTTHFMDEADILADYKAIMTKGKLRCAGSSLFLKNRFGIGYHLTMAISDDCDCDALKSLVKNHVEGADVIRHHGKELAFALPVDQVNSFAGLFATLEDNNDSEETCAATRLGVSSYGVSMTTLEEVFLQLEDTKEEKEEDTHEPNLDGSRNLLVPTAETSLSGSQASNLHHTGVELDFEETRKYEGMPKLTGQLVGLLKTQWLQSIRTPMKIFFMVIVPPILLIVGLVLIKVSSSKRDVNLVQVPIAPSMYVTPASTESYATPILFKNSTGSPLDNVYEFLKDYKIDFDVVKSLDEYLNISYAEKPNRFLGVDAKRFPTNNMSAHQNVNFLMRYNDSAVHSIPVGVNIISTLFNMFVLKAKGETPHSIKTYFQAFPTLKPKPGYSNAFIAVMLIGLSFAVIPGGFGIVVVQQRQLNIRHLLRVSGVSTFMYWLYLFISDAVVFLIPAVLLLILIPAIQIPSLSSGPAMGCLIIAVLLYIPTGILYSYCLSFLFDKWETAQLVLPNIFTNFTLIPFLAVSIVDMVGFPDTSIILHYVFAFLLPTYNLVGALYFVNRIHLIGTIVAQSTDISIPVSTYFAWSKHNGIPVSFIAMVLYIIILAILLHFLDTRNTGGQKMKYLCSSPSKHNVDGHPRKTKRNSSTHSHDSIEDDVKEEKEKILRTDLTDKTSGGLSVAVKGLWKRFRKGKDTNDVVKDLYFGVERGEVFGLLGPNGAGKTTTLNMIIGAIAPTRGQVNVAGFDMNTESDEIYQRMGYCPQTDAVWDTLTLEEHLIAYCHIRGIPKQDIGRFVRHYMSAMRVTEHAKKRAKDLSGGTKRKLSFQMAMLGGPELLLLDEPSTGLDPSARRFLWNTISKNVKGDRGAILTTHSMEEADALSSRIGIMVKGQLKCLGSTQHLKTKYGSGYSLEVKLTDHSQEAQTKLESLVKELFPGATINEIFGGKSTYKIPKENVSRLSYIFTKLEQGLSA